ncbi:hypothetical protein [Cohnella sp.]|uniref:hypothetical protein n=1 Tax=Cohnella sp. TaxID=1883426 RepID=UPI003564710E
MNVISAQGTMVLAEQDRNARLESLNGLLKSLYDQQEIVQEVIIDGVNYRDQYNNYLLENLMDIQSVEIKSVQEAVLMQSIAEDLKEYLPKLIRGCDSIPELLYGEMKEEDWGYFGQLMEGTNWVGQSALALRTYGDKRLGAEPIHASVVQFVDGLEKHVEELGAAMEQQDYTSAADLIKYEMSESFKHLLAQLEAETTS